MGYPPTQDNNSSDSNGLQQDTSSDNSSNLNQAVPAQKSKIKLSPTVRRRRIGSALKGFRDGSGIRAEEVADRLGVTTSTLYRMESGAVGIKPRDVEALANYYGVNNREEVEELMRLAKESRQRGWWARYSDAITPPYATYIGLEESAAALKLYDSLIINGLLQTENYARATFDLAGERSMALKEKRIELRLQRQVRLGSTLSIHNIIDEGALRRVIGGPSIMREQLSHLLDQSDSEGVTIRMLPFDAGKYPGMLSSFTIMTFPLDETGYLHPDVIYVESHNGDIYEEDDDIKPFTEVFANLDRFAKGPEDTRDFIRTLIKRLNSDI